MKKSVSNTIVSGTALDLFFLDLSGRVISGDIYTRTVFNAVAWYINTRRAPRFWEKAAITAGARAVMKIGLSAGSAAETDIIEKLTAYFTRRFID